MEVGRISKFERLEALRTLLALKVIGDTQDDLIRFKACVVVGGNYQIVVLDDGDAYTTVIEFSIVRLSLQL